MKRIISVTLALVMLFIGGGVGPSMIGSMQTASAQSDCQSFPQTGMTLCGRFRQYWESHGGLAQQGYPITNTGTEQSQTDSKTYTVQYFERAVFEYHPENPYPNDVLLSLLGVFQWQRKYAQPPADVASPEPGAQRFSQTGKTVGGRFLQYWQQHGGMAQQGLPLSNELNEVSELDGKTYKVQYFERAVFEYHPENPYPNDVLLSQLGTFRYNERYKSAHYALPVASAPLANPAAEPLPASPSVNPPPVATHRTPRGFAAYIASKYTTIGGQQFNLSDYFVNENEYFGHWISFDIGAGGTSKLRSRVTQDQVDVWARNVQREAKANWSDENFRITLDWTTYADTPCLSNCNGDCYNQSADYSPRQGWFTVFTYVVIDSRDGIVDCPYLK